MSIVDDFENLIENRVRGLVVTPCLAKIIKVDGNLCDCEGIDIEDPESKAIYPLLEIPTLLGTKGGGIGGKPAIGSIVLLNFLNGDRNHPVISALIKGENSGNFTSLAKDKIKISSNGKDLGEILVKFCDMISQLQTTGSMGPSTMNPSQIFEWKLFVDKEIKGMFAVGLGSENDNDNGENEEQDSLSEATKQAYLDISFNDKELTELDTSGKYELQSYDLLAIEEDYLLFWERVIPITGLSESEFHSIRDAADLKKDEVKNKKIGDIIFVPSKKGINSITVRYKSSDLNKISGTAEERLKCIVLYYNALYNKSQREIVITDTKRTPLQQAKEVYNSVKGNGGKAQGSMYQGYSGMFVEQELKKGTSQKDIEDMVAAGIHSPYKTGIPQKLNGKMEIFTGFSHVNAPNNTADIGILNSNTWAKSDDFPNVLSKFISAGKYLNTQTLIYPTKGETECHHLVILT